MRIAALYDIHGNLPALEAVLADVRASRVDSLIIGGDVMPGPMPRECLDALLTSGLPTDFIIGNGDRETLSTRTGVVSAPIPESFREVMKWNAAQLRDTDLRLIGSWPLVLHRTIDGLGRVLFCHATPRNDTEIFTAATNIEKLKPVFEPLDVDVVVCGHTHMQFDRMVGTTRVVNAGSVGMPFEAPGAYWLLIDSKLELRRTEYDLDRAAARVRRSAYPQAEEYASKSILNPPLRDEMISGLSKAELT